MIDMHMHVGRLYHMESKPLTPSYLLKFMDSHDIERACLHPIESPEETDYYITTEYVLRVCKRHPDRFVPFCNVDPRHRHADTSTPFLSMLREHRDRGCKGFGEAMAGVWIDDDRMQKIYEACGELKLPIVFHIDALRNIDDPGMPRLEAMLAKFPETVFVGHGPSFWAEVSADRKPGDLYPKGPVVRGGAVERLLAKYPNAYADLSAGSGHNAMSRDADYGRWFLDRFQDKLMFGTDICRYNLQFPMFDLLKEAGLSAEAYEKITRANAIRVFDL